MTARWWVEECTTAPIEADTDLCFDTAAAEAAEAVGHGAPWAVIDHPDAYTSGPVSPRHLIVAGHRGHAAYYLASREAVRDGDRGTRFHVY